VLKWWRKYIKSKVGVTGLVVFAVIVVAIILAPYVATTDPKQNSYPGFEPPILRSHTHVNLFSGETELHGIHILGTNSVGEDVWSQLWYAGRVSLLIGVVASVIITTIGTAVGMISGYFGGLVDEMIVRFCDMLMVLPRFPMMILMAAFLGPGIPSIMFVVIVFGWTAPTRAVRAQVLSVKQRTYVEAARSIGGSRRHIIWNHILPNVLGVAIANFVLETMRVIMLEASLSFLGLGDPLILSWGMMLHYAQAEGGFSVGAWWWFVPPGLMICLLGASCNFIGTTINDRIVLKIKRGIG